MAIIPLCVSFSSYLIHILPLLPSLAVLARRENIQSLATAFRFISHADTFYILFMLIHTPWHSICTLRLYRVVDVDNMWMLSDYHELCIVECAEPPLRGKFLAPVPGQPPSNSGDATANNKGRRLANAAYNVWPPLYKLYYQIYTFSQVENRFANSLQHKLFVSVHNKVVKTAAISQLWSSFMILISRRQGILIEFFLLCKTDNSIVQRVLLLVKCNLTFVLNYMRPWSWKWITFCGGRYLPKKIIAVCSINLQNAISRVRVIIAAFVLTKWETLKYISRVLSSRIPCCSWCSWATRDCAGNCDASRDSRTIQILLRLELSLVSAILRPGIYDLF